MALGLSTREGQKVAIYSIVFSERLGSSERNQGLGRRTSLWHLTVYLPKPSYDVLLYGSPQNLYALRSFGREDEKKKGDRLRRGILSSAMLD